jgi:hypothetical protein
LDRRSRLAIILQIANFRAGTAKPVATECVVGHVIAGAGVADVYSARDIVVAVGVNYTLGWRAGYMAFIACFTCNVVQICWILFVKILP